MMKWGNEMYKELIIVIFVLIFILTVYNVKSILKLSKSSKSNDKDEFITDNEEDKHFFD